MDPQAQQIQKFKETACYAECARVCADWGPDVPTAAAGKVVQMMDRCAASLIKHGYAGKQRLHVKEVGGTPMNRDYEGLSWDRGQTE